MWQNNSRPPEPDGGAWLTTLVRPAATTWTAATAWTAATTWTAGTNISHGSIAHGATTGLYPDSDEFIQIAAVRYQSGCLCREDDFFSYARPRRSIPSFITGYTGISNDDVRHAPHPEEVLCQFARWAGDSTLVAHNGLRFDSKFLAATCRRHQLPSREIQCIDSIHISKMLFGSTRGTGHSLDHLKQRLGLRDTTLRRHDARGDVDLLGRAVEEMSRRLGLDTAFNGVRRHTSLLPHV